MRTIVIGTGICGAVAIGSIPDAIVFDKSKKVGGRTNTKHWKDGSIFDIGATYLEPEVFFQKDGSKESFRIIEEFEPNFFTDGPLGKIFPKNGMNAISMALKKNHEILFGKKVLSIQKETDCFYLGMEDGEELVADRVILTCPLPQVDQLLKGSIREKWKPIYNYFQDYRSCLVGAAYFPNWNYKEKEWSYLWKGEELEYVSFESSKYQHKGTTVMIQAGEQFSKKHRSEWRNPEDHAPSDFFHKTMKTWMKTLSRRLFWNLQEEYSETFAHVWRYSQAKNSIMDKNKEMDFNSEDYKTWEATCRKTDLWILGDWVFGSRVERIYLGTKIALTDLQKE